MSDNVYKTTTSMLPDMSQRVALPFDVMLETVPYFNATPLTCALARPIGTAHPSELAKSLRNGKIDGALVPVMEIFQSPSYLVVDEVAIACDGEVHSVFLSLHVPLAQVQTVALDPASLTSRALTRVVLEIFHGLRPRYVPAGTPEAEPDAELWIGDQALQYRDRHPQAKLLDLGSEWKRQTGLPFVFALWALNPSLANAREIAVQLRRAQILGLAQRMRLARSAKQFKYLMEFIRYEVHASEKQALDLFGEHLLTLGEIRQKPQLNWI